MDEEKHSNKCCLFVRNLGTAPWLVRLSGLNAGLHAERLPVRFLHAWVKGQAPAGGVQEATN